MEGAGFSWTGSESEQVTVGDSRPASHTFSEPSPALQMKDTTSLARHRECAREKGKESCRKTPNATSDQTNPDVGRCGEEIVGAGFVPARHKKPCADSSKPA